MPSTLVVIDMQEAFHAAHNTFTLYHVLEEIRRAKKRKDGIVLVQYEEGGALLRKVREVTYGYHDLDIAWKYTNDGGKEVYDCIVSNGFNYQHLIVCGVNSDVCVRETVQTLSLDFPYTNIELVEDACNSYGFNDFSWINELPNVTLRESRN